jgi:hypothetical protein
MNCDKLFHGIVNTAWCPRECIERAGVAQAGAGCLKGALIGLIMGMFVALGWQSSRRQNSGK